MAEADYVKFDRRMRQILKEHRKLSRGYITSVNHDGLVIARPRPQVNRTTTMLRGVFVCMVTLLAFKVVVLARLGPEAYAERVAFLENGGVVEQIGAYAMAADPVTVWIANNLPGHTL